ncbi:MAG: hypothetical protein VXZ82_07290 [Planctomycetota bacterium]|nr:hypothetical protein [Planctomycetota bacterium]
MRDMQLGQAILEPALSGPTWLHHITRPWHDNNLVMGVAAWGDSGWAMKKVLNLSEKLVAKDDVYLLHVSVLS